MPQLDFFAIQAQIICLIFSVFFIYFFLLKYVIPTHDVYKRLNLKKLNYWKTHLEILAFLSLNFKQKTLLYVLLVSNILIDYSKISLNFLNNFLPILYSATIKKKRILSFCNFKTIKQNLMHLSVNPELSSLNNDIKRKELVKQFLKKLTKKKKIFISNELFF